jgi:hypothetical protein
MHTITPGMGLGMFVSRLVRAPARTRTLILSIMATTTALAIWWLGPVGLAVGLAASVLPSYLLLNHGPSHTRSYTLFVSTAPVEPGGYREAQRPTLGALLEKLGALGYRLEALAADADGNPTSALDASAPLCGPVIWLRLAGAAPYQGGVRLRMPEGPGAGEVDATDTPSGRYEELAQYTIVALGRLFRGTTFKESFSSLTPESTEWLEPQLPDRPRALP